MSNRKKILAVILFLIFGTTIYTFANPATTSDEKDKTNEEEVIDDKETDEEVTNPIIVDDGVNNIVNPVVQQNQNVAVIDENIQLAFELADLKSSAILLVRNHLDTVNVKYREEQLLEITKIIDEAVKKIEEATTKEEVIIIRDKAISDLDNVLTDEELYILETKKVVFLDRNDEELLSTRVKIGETLEAPTIDNTYTEKGITYVFINWDKDFSKVEEDLIIKPFYEISEINSKIVLDNESIGAVKLEILNNELLEIIINNVNKEIEVSDISTYIAEGEILPVLADNDEFLKYEFYAISYNEEGFTILTKKVLDNSKLDLYRNKTKEKIMSHRDSLIFSDSYIASADKEVTDALLTILELKTKSSIDKLVLDTKNKLDSIYLENIKSNAKKELLAYSKTFPFAKSFAKTIEDLIIKGNSTIDNANTITLVNSTLSSYKKEISDLANVKATFNIKGSNFIRLTRTNLWEHTFGNEKVYVDDGIGNIVSNTEYTTNIKYIYIKPYLNTETVVNNVDLSYGTKIGTYKIIYEIKNHAGTTILDRTVVVNRAIDEEFEGNDLQIKFNNYDVYNVCRTSYCNTPTIDLSVKAYDRVDGILFGKTDISNKIVILSNNVDTTKIGEYKVVYEVTDWAGYKYKRTRTIKIKDNIAPTITLSSSETIDVNVEGVIIKAKKAYVTDNYDLNLGTDIDPRFEYTYKWLIFVDEIYVTGFEYTAKDSSGNKKTVSYDLPTKIRVK
ncbi:MAG: DUF5011 domain-containing protein [Bacilli bacterium]|nr:DUF5011 domain-containing protein [Bacilli bacterium]